MREESTRRAFMGATLGWAGLAACSPSEVSEPESDSAESGASADPKMSFGARHMSAMLASLLPPVICAGVLNTRNRVVVFSDGLLYLDVPARC